MSFLFITANIVLLFYLVFLNRKKEVFSQPSVHFLLINICAVFTSNYLISVSRVNYDTMSAEVFYSILHVICVFSLVHINKSVSNNIGLSMKNISIDSSKILKRISVFSIFNIVLMVFFLMSIKMDLLYKNYKYLTIVDSEKMGLDYNVLMVLYHKLLPINGLVSFFLYKILITNKRHSIYKIPAIMYFIIGVIIVVIELAVNSRSAGLIISGLLVSVFLFDKKSLLKHVKIVGLLLLIFLSYRSTIFGRSRTTQGVSQIQDNLLNTNNRGKSLKVDFLLENLFGGVQVFLRAKDLSGDYPQQYKILSFSPLPSFIDKFKQYNKYQNRISWYEPYSANVEVYHFGYWYCFIYFLILFYGLRQMNLMVKRDKFLGYLISLPGYLFFLVNQQYPLRTSFRFFLMSVLISIVYMKVKKEKPLIE